MYVSGGPYKAYSYGPCTIELRRRANRGLLDCSPITCTVVQALKALGRGDVDDEVIEPIARNLSDGDVETLRRESRGLTSWVAGADGGEARWIESHGETKRVYSVTTEAKALLFDECVSLGSGTAAVRGGCSHV